MSKAIGLSIVATNIVLLVVAVNDDNPIWWVSIVAIIMGVLLLKLEKEVQP